MPALRTIIAGLLLLSAPLSAAEEPLATPIEGEPFSARLESVEHGWKFKFIAAGQTRMLAGAELVSWGRPADPASGTQVLLVGGGLIVTDTVRLEEESLTGASATLGAWTLPMDTCAGIVLRGSHSLAAQETLQRRIANAKGRGDRLLLDNGDELSGTITALSDSSVTLRGEGPPLEVKLDNLTAIVFDPSLLAEPESSGLRAIVGLHDGSHLLTEKLLADDRNAKLTLVGGGELQTAAAWVVFIQMLGGRAVYLSDLEPASYRHLPLLTLTWPYHEDRNVRGAPLRAGGRRYFKGLGMHSPSRITYELDGAYRRFEAEVAVDDGSAPRGSVAFRVFTDDGSGDWQQQVTTPIVRGGEPPRRVAAEIGGAKRVSLLVDFADRGDELDHADWLDARLIK